MLLDLRFPMGLLFVLLGALLAGYGWLGDKSVYEASLGINVNVWSGLGILVFGAAMLVGGWRAMAGAKKQEAGSTNQEARSKKA